MRHVVWDWNGTLLDDQHVVLGALNAVLADRDLPPTDMETYRRLYTRPVRRFYEQLFGHPIDDEEWQHLVDVFHQAYHAELEAARLATDAPEALDGVEAVGASQSLLSMFRHDALVPLVRRFDLHHRFVRVDGLRGPGGVRKARSLVSHLAALELDGSDVLVIGDALDDADAAAHVGARCVLYDGGSHPRDELEQAGVPVASSLVEAVACAEELHWEAHIRRG